MIKNEEILIEMGEIKLTNYRIVQHQKQEHKSIPLEHASSFQITHESKGQYIFYGLLLLVLFPIAGGILAETVKTFPPEVGITLGLIGLIYYVIRYFMSIKNHLVITSANGEIRAVIQRHSKDHCINFIDKCMDAIQENKAKNNTQNNDTNKAHLTYTM